MKRADNGGAFMNKEGKVIIKNMEFLLKELHKEWDRTGEIKANVAISLEEIENTHKKLIERISIVQDAAENESMSFNECIQLSKECYVLLRMIKKIKMEEEKANMKGIDIVISVQMDKEELRYYKEIFKEECK